MTTETLPDVAPFPTQRPIGDMDAAIAVFDSAPTIQAPPGSMDAPGITQLVDENRRQLITDILTAYGTPAPEGYCHCCAHNACECQGTDVRPIHPDIRTDAADWLEVLTNLRATVEKLYEFGPTADYKSDWDTAAREVKRAGDIARRLLPTS